MKASHFYFTSLVGFIGLVLSIALVVVDQSNQKLQVLVMEQQKTLNQGASNQQVLQNIVRDLAHVSAKDERIKELLAHNGFTVSANSPASAQ